MSIEDMTDEDLQTAIDHAEDDNNFEYYYELMDEYSRRCDAPTIPDCIVITRYSQGGSDGSCKRYMLIAAVTKERALDAFWVNFGGNMYSHPGGWFQHEPWAHPEPVATVDTLPVWKVTQYCGLDI